METTVLVGLFTVTVPEEGGEADKQVCKAQLQLGVPNSRGLRVSAC